MEVDSKCEGCPRGRVIGLSVEVRVRLVAALVALRIFVGHRATFAKGGQPPRTSAALPT